jgi:hypothetical protein
MSCLKAIYIDAKNQELNLNSGRVKIQFLDYVDTKHLPLGNSFGLL